MSARTDYQVPPKITLDDWNRFASKFKIYDDGIGFDKIYEKTSGGGINLGDGALFVDQANKRVGANNTSPRFELDVDGSAWIRNRIYVPPQIVGPMGNALQRALVHGSVSATGGSTPEQALSEGDTNYWNIPDTETLPVSMTIDLGKKIYRVVQFVLRSDWHEASHLPQGFKIAGYMRSQKPLSYPISRNDLKAVDSEIAEMFEGGAWFTAIIYQGNLEDLREDLEIGRSWDKSCRLIGVEVEKGVYKVGEPVRIRVNFIHLLPGCFEVMMLHHHEIRLEVIGEDGVLREWRWKTAGDFSKTVSWTPEEEGSYRIRASSWFNGRILEVQAEKLIEVRGGEHGDREDLLASLILSGLAFGGAFTALGVAIGYLAASKLKRG